MGLLLGIFTSIYPDIYLSGISPKEVLASHVFISRTGKPVRNILNIIQFAIAIILMTVILFMQMQIRFSKTQSVGFNTERLLRLDLQRQPPEIAKLLEDKLRTNPEILSISATMGVPGDIQRHVDDHVCIGIDTSFYRTFGIDVINGRRLLPGDMDKACLINETALKKYDDGNYKGKKVNGEEVVGVVKDFRVTSVHKGIKPMMLDALNWLDVDNLTLRIRGNNIQEFMGYVQKVWKEVCPDYLFRYNFYDEWFNSMYRNEEDLEKLISLFAFLAVAISSLGILGLALFATEQRSKEIGLRKVNGASSFLVMTLLLKDFTKLILISFLLGVPISYYIVDRWLSNFAYHARMSWWIFAMAGLIAFLVAIFTVSFQCWKIASKNPVEILKYE
jgi:putative ABC transport system permease protein